MKMPRSSLIDAMMTLTVKPLVISCLTWLSYHAPFRSGRMDQLKNAIFTENSSSPNMTGRR